MNKVSYIRNWLFALTMFCIPLLWITLFLGYNNVVLNTICVTIVFVYIVYVIIIKLLRCEVNTENVINRKFENSSFLRILLVIVPVLFFLLAILSRFIGNEYISSIFVYGLIITCFYSAFIFQFINNKGLLDMFVF